MKVKAEQTRARLEALRKDLLKRKDLLRVIVAEKALKHQAKKAQLQVRRARGRGRGGRGCKPGRRHGCCRCC